MKIKNLAALIAAATVAVSLTGCAVDKENQTGDGDVEITERLPETLPPVGITPEDPPTEEPPTETQPPGEEEPPAEEPPAVKPPTVSEPKVQTVSYVKVTSDNVNIRTGAGTGYAIAGTAEKSTLYACLGEENGWYKTRYRNKIVYISKKYCVITEMNKSDNEQIEAVIAEGTKFMGVPYVYGAVRLHDGKGNMYKSFSVNAFDCSSLMQYIFYKGADKLLQVNTRTQIYQGKTVSKANLKRGDLMFFTNASRKNNTGIERVGHVALYLGDNYILHTASDYAKIEQISSTRWGYYIQSQRII